MNIEMISYILSWTVQVEGLFLILPIIISLFYKEVAGWPFLAVMAICLIIGFIGTRKKPQNMVFFAKEGFVVVALSWIIMSVIGALPFYLTGEIPSYVDALFETISGFTTTGASILNDVEALSHASLFWRSFTHWIGGMGVLVFILAILPLTGAYNMHIMKAESPGPSVGKLVPKVRNTAKILYEIYILITLIEILLLLAGGMPLFDALTLSFGTAGTGGFGIKNTSLADYTMYQQAVISIFMILFGINFGAYFLFLSKKFKQGFGMEEVRWYLIIISISTIYIAWDIRADFSNLFESFHHALFQVGSIITTTGYSTCDFNLWSSTSKTILVFLMFVGACAGSTGGGFKVSRIVIMAKTVKKEIAYYIHPRSIKKIQMDGRSIEHEVIRSVNVFLISYMMIFAVSVFIISFDHKDLITNFTSVLATMNNIGPGLGEVGPAANFANFSILSKFTMMFDMLVGRLEIFPMLILFAPQTWKK